MASASCQKVITDTAIAQRAEAPAHHGGRSESLGRRGRRAPSRSPEEDGPGPDFQTGYGKVDALLAAETVNDGRFIDDTIDPAQHKRYYFKASSPPNSSFRVLMAYSDEEGA